jgi:hypothetical protein
MLFERFGLKMSEAEAQHVVAQPYAEALLHALGAEVADSMDASSYEGASIIHDLNRPISEEMKCKYTCVLEYGTLEHVFNFPAALKNTIDMIEVGGHLLTITPANNFMGHGFYQFSPELYYGFLSANGFEQIEVYIVPYRWLPHLFRVADPRRIRGRVELVNSEPMQMGVIARKAKHLPEMVVPIQSDYQNTFWEGRDINRKTKSPNIDPKLATALAEFRTRLNALASWPETLSPQWLPGFENTLYYQVMDPAID